MTDVRFALSAAKIPYQEYGITAVDAYCGHSMRKPVEFFLVQGGIVDLAKLFPHLEYPALPYADAALTGESTSADARFVLTDDLGTKCAGCSGFFDFRRDPRDGRFIDPKGIYPFLKARRYSNGDYPGENELFETALFLSRLSSAEEKASKPRLPGSASISPLWQKDLLTLILQAPGSVRALDYLKDSGFLETYWPDLYALLQVDHAKDCHPEGGGWSHTMEALGHRKTRELTLSLAILLHDLGKPHSEAFEGRKFDRHAEIGAKLAENFLRKLGFDSATVGDVRFLIRWHMLPAALPRIPIEKVSDIVLDERFPTLLELYRCDEFSTFKGPDAYYAACAAYRSFVRHSKNLYHMVSRNRL
jgi:poly(A) polymerase